MGWPRAALEFGGQRTGLHGGAQAVGIHRRGSWRESDFHAFGPQLRQVVVRGAGIASRSSPAPNCIGLTKIDTTTTDPGTRLAARTNARWPSCSAPIVGTNITRRPVSRSARLTSATSPGAEYTLSSPGWNAGIVMPSKPRRHPRGRVRAARSAARLSGMPGPALRRRPRGPPDDPRPLPHRRGRPVR